MPEKIPLPSEPSPEKATSATSLPFDELVDRAERTSLRFKQSNKAARFILRRRMWHDANFGDAEPLSDELHDNVAGLYGRTAAVLEELMDRNYELQPHWATDEFIDQVHREIIGQRSEAMIQALCYRRMKGNPDDHIFYLPATEVGDNLADQQNRTIGYNPDRPRPSYDGWLVRRAWKPTVRREATKLQIKTSRLGSQGKAYEPHILVMSAEAVAGKVNAAFLQGAIIMDSYGKATQRQQSMLRAAGDRIYSYLEDHLQSYPDKL